MNSASTDTIEQIKYLIGGMVWNGSEITEGEVFGSLQHLGFEEAKIDIAIGELLDSSEILSTIIQVSTGFMPGLRRAAPLTAEQKRVELDAALRAHAAASRKSDARDCASHEKEIRLMGLAMR